MCLVWRRAGRGDEVVDLDGKEYTQMSSGSERELEHHSMKRRSMISCQITAREDSTSMTECD
jgi:hypothetical protein